MYTMIMIAWQACTRKLPAYFCHELISKGILHQKPPTLPTCEHIQGNKLGDMENILKGRRKNIPAPVHI